MQANNLLEEFDRDHAVQELAAEVAGDTRAGFLKQAGVRAGALTRPLPPEHRHPVTFGVAEPFDDDIYNVQIRAADYYSFATMVLVAVAVVFELPVFTGPAGASMTT